jgi:hypothetical protein
MLLIQVKILVIFLVILVVKSLFNLVLVAAGRNYGNGEKRGGCPL